MLTPCQCGKVVNLDVDLGDTCIHYGECTGLVGRVGKCLSDPSV